MGRAKSTHRSLYLDDESVRALPFANGERGVYVARDTKLTGFLCIVNRKSKRLVFQSEVRAVDKRRAIYTRLGDPAHVKVNEARAKALEEAARLERLTVPEARAGLTFAEAWEEYKTELTKRGSSERTKGDYAQKYEDHLEPTFGKVALKDITRLNVRHLHGRLTKEVGPYCANGVARVGHAVYRYAALELEVPDLAALNPFRSYNLFNPEEKRQTGLPEKQLAAWFKQVLALDNPIMREFWLMVALTGLRRRDVTTMKWEHVNLKDSYIAIPAPKGGKERAFRCPITPPMARLLKRVNAAGEVLCDLERCHPWVFPSIASKSGHVEEPRSGKLDTSPHALRHTFRTMAAGAKVTPIHSKLLMNHKVDGDVHSGYMTVPAMFDQLRQASDAISTYFMKHLPKDAERRLQCALPK